MDIFITRPQVVNYFNIDNCHFDDCLFDGGSLPFESEVISLLESEDNDLYQQLKRNTGTVRSYQQQLDYETDEMEHEERMIYRNQTQQLTLDNVRSMVDGDSDQQDNNPSPIELVQPVDSLTMHPESAVIQLDPVENNVVR